jgi:hypothetical protein
MAAASPQGPPPIIIASSEFICQRSLHKHSLLTAPPDRQGSVYILSFTKQQKNLPSIYDRRF